jgi:hypothetical protein
MFRTVTFEGQRFQGHPRRILTFRRDVSGNLVDEWESSQGAKFPLRQGAPSAASVKAGSRRGKSFKRQNGL